MVRCVIIMRGPTNRIINCFVGASMKAHLGLETGKISISPSSHNDEHKSGGQAEGILVKCLHSRASVISKQVND